LKCSSARGTRSRADTPEGFAGARATPPSVSPFLFRPTSPAYAFPVCSVTEAIRDSRLLVGRSRERNALDRLLADVRNGRSRTLVLRGDPGVGKTALLEYAAESASGLRVAGTIGAESDLELPFAALHQLCAPMLGGLGLLIERHRDALSSAFGLTAGDSPERFVVGVAALNLLAEHALRQPVLCVIDDAQWLDEASAHTLGFVARRLLAEPVGMLFATRHQSAALAGLEELEVRGLADDDARLLLATVIDGHLDDRARDRIVADTRGNPLALIEFTRGSSAAELAVGLDVAATGPLAGRIEQTFLARVRQLPPDSQRLLVVAAAEAVGDAAKVWRAADRLRIGRKAAVAPAEAGLLEIGAGVRFHHPLVRSAVYGAAPVSDLRAVHLALAAATDGERDPDRRAWHLAAAAAGPDERVAAELERAAARAEERGGLAAAAAFLERAVELTPGGEERARRLLAASRTQLAAGALQRARSLIDQVSPAPADPMARAETIYIDAALRFATGHGEDTPTVLVDAATAFWPLDRELARGTLLEALEAAQWAGHLSSSTVLSNVTAAAHTMSSSGEPKSTASLLLEGYAQQALAGYPAGVRWWRLGIEQNLREKQRQPAQWHGMVWNAAGHLLDFELMTAVARKWLRQVREHGALSKLGQAASAVAFSEMLSGRIEAAEALVRDALETATATGAPSMPGAEGINSLTILTWRGEERESRAQARAIRAGALAQGQGLGVTLVDFFMMKLELSLRHYDAARSHALSILERDPFAIGTMALGDIVETAVRAEDLEMAQTALARLTTRAEASGSAWGLGLLSRSRALLASDPELLFEESLEQLRRAGVVAEFARGLLLYGEWLRRQHRRRDARLRLRAAHEMFESMGAAAYQQRAALELLATGEHARTTASETRDRLTPQEQQVAEMAAEGESNAEIAAQLFLSQHTVAYHLRKVFVKLGVTKRIQLADALGA
jgi:DNA-binding CsgD family transcriptional regulator